MMAVEFDEEELLHLALHASANQRHDQAMGYLKSATRRFPLNAKARYLLGAEHAHIGMYDRAIADIGEAIRLDPSLTAAHFQLGLLYLTSGAAQEAERAWAVLDGLAKTEPLYQFKVGLTHLIHDRLEECAAALEQGIALNSTLPPLNVDMQRVLDEVRTRLTSGTYRARENPGLAPSREHALLFAYRQNSDEPAKGST
jgi:tetratricopeptide (TPR) repeat protein